MIYFNSEIYSEVVNEQTGLFSTSEVSYFIGYYSLEDGGIKLFRMPKDKTVIYCDLAEGEPFYAEYKVDKFGSIRGEIKLHLSYFMNDNQ